MVCGLSSWLQVQYHFHNDTHPSPAPVFLSRSFSTLPESKKNHSRRVLEEMTAMQERREREREGQGGEREGEGNKDQRRQDLIIERDRKRGERERKRERTGQKNTIKHFAGDPEFNEYRLLGPEALVARPGL